MNPQKSRSQVGSPSPDGSSPSGDDRKAERGDRSSIQAASADALGHGITIAVSIGLFMWVGDRLDRWLGTGHVLVLIGMLLGAAAGFYRLYAHMVLLPRQQNGSNEPVDDHGRIEKGT